MNNQPQKSVVDEVLAILEPKGFTKKEVEEQLTQLMKVCILRMEHDLLQEVSIAPQSLTPSMWEKFIKDCAENNPELHQRITKEFSSLLEEYLAAI